MRTTPLILLSLVVALAASAIAAPLAAQSPPDTLRYGLFSGTKPVAYVKGAYVSRVLITRTGPDSAPNSTALADSVLLPALAIRGYGVRFVASGTASASNQKSVVLNFTAAGATTRLDSLQMKVGGGQWRIECQLIVRNPTSGVTTGDSTQVLSCSHSGSADSSTTASAAPLTSTVKMVAGQTSNRFRLYNGIGTAKGDVVVTGIVVTASPGGLVNP
jgi:hypothetical protein